MLLLGIDPGKKKKIAMKGGKSILDLFNELMGKGAKASVAPQRSGKAILDLFDEMMGKGAKQVDDVVARKPLDTSYITGKNPNAVTMQDVLKGTKKSLDMPAFEREALGLVKRVSIPAGKGQANLSRQQLLQNAVKGNQSQIAKMRELGIGVEDTGSFLPALIRQIGKAGPGMPNVKRQSDLMRILEEISNTLNKGPFG